jgi:predicted ArsR family transcriptional regulator
MVRERNDSGRYVETVGQDDILMTFDAVNGPVITSTDVADHLDCTTEAARQKLKRLVEDGALARRRTGRTFVYWRVDRETSPDDNAQE